MKLSPDHKFAKLVAIPTSILIGSSALAACESDSRPLHAASTIRSTHNPAISGSNNVDPEKVSEKQRQLIEKRDKLLNKLYGSYYVIDSCLFISAKVDYANECKQDPVDQMASTLAAGCALRPGLNIHSEFPGIDSKDPINPPSSTQLDNVKKAVEYNYRNTGLTIKPNLASNYDKEMLKCPGSSSDPDNYNAWAYRQLAGAN